MFLLGVLILRNFEKLKSALEGKFLYYLFAYIAFMALQHAWIADRSLPFYLAYLPSRIVLALATIAAAFSLRSLSHRLLGGTDISYGIYIYHSIVINVMVQVGMMTSMLSVGVVYAISIALALLSWHAVEKPALACKSASPSDLWRRIAGAPGEET